MTRLYKKSMYFYCLHTFEQDLKGTKELSSSSLILTSLHVTVWIGIYSKVCTFFNYLPETNSSMKIPMAAQLLKELSKFYGAQKFSVMFK